MRKVLSALAIVISVFLCSCGNQTVIQNSAETVEISEEAQQLAFGKALWDIYQRGILPDGEALDYISMEAASANRFALADVDGDERDELLLCWTTASMAGMREYVLGYDGEAVYVELSAFPGLRYYDNGIVEADWSHNQGLAGEFWPYSVYCYEAESDTYRLAGSVDAWNKELREINYDDEPFPAKIDADGDGIVYYLIPADWEGRYSEALLVDGEDYEMWQDSYLEDAGEIGVMFRELTEENIASFGYPKPDVKITEPKG